MGMIFDSILGSLSADLQHIGRDEKSSNKKVDPSKEAIKRFQRAVDTDTLIDSLVDYLESEGVRNTEVTELTKFLNNNKESIRKAWKSLSKNMLKFLATQDKTYLDKITADMKSFGLDPDSLKKFTVSVSDDDDEDDEEE